MSDKNPMPAFPNPIHSSDRGIDFPFDPAEAAATAHIQTVHGGECRCPLCYPGGIKTQKPVEPPRQAREWWLASDTIGNIYAYLTPRGWHGAENWHVREVLPSLPLPDTEEAFEEWWNNRPESTVHEILRMHAKAGWSARQPHINRLFQE